MTTDATAGARPPVRPIRRLLIANRGEIATCIARTAAELGIETVAVFSRDDAIAPTPRAHASRCGVPVLSGTDRTATLEEARALRARLGSGGAVMLEALRALPSRPARSGKKRPLVDTW